METKWIRELLSFSRKERNGIIVLLAVIFILIVIGELVPAFIHRGKPDTSNWKAEVDSFLDQSKMVNSNEMMLSLSEFDPNRVDSVQLSEMGIPLKVKSNWLKYIEKGGRFKDKSDVKRIYGMTDILYRQLENYISIPVKVDAEANSGKSKTYPLPITKTDSFITKKSINPETNRVKLVELNCADSMQLIDIHGIGPVFASRIIRYRKLLGGYYSVSQLKEVYGLREENYVLIANYFTVDPSKINTLNINFATIQELGHHPYIGYKAAKRIYKLRDQVGKFQVADDLKSVLSTDSLNRIIPYLKFGL